MRVGQEKYAQRDDHPPHRQPSEGVGTDSEEAKLDRQEDKKKPAYHEKNCHQDANVTPRPAAVRARQSVRYPRMNPWCFDFARTLPDGREPQRNLRSLRD